ncbi:MAG: ABC transporter ATP-binding protein [Planctomycetes bacterium]|nr:ABC transporter ATP-binding protein [Planctomycetota bacterium]
MKVLSTNQEAWSLSKRFWVDVRPFRLALGVSLVLQLLGVGLQLMQPWPIQWIFDNILMDPEGKGTRVVLFAALALVGITVARIALEYWGSLKIVAAGHGVTRALRLRIFRKLVELPPHFHARQKAGDLLMRLMGDAPMVSTMMVESGTHLLLRSVQAAATIGVMFWVDATLTWTLLGLFPVVYLVAGILAKKLTIATKKQRRKEGELADSMQESIGAASMIQALGQEQHVVHEFARSNRRSARAGLKTAKAAARLSSSVEATLAIGLGATVFLGTLRAMQPEAPLSPGELLVFLSYVRGLLKPLRAASKHQARVAKGVACGQRITQVLDRADSVQYQSGTLTPRVYPETIELERVDYTYPDGTIALKGVSGVLRAGEIVTLVGPSGAGKSTLLSLLVRLMDPTGGRVLMDGTPLPEFELDALRSRLGVALQTTLLLGMSVRDNLLLGRPDATDEEMWDALERAGADRFVQELPEGLGEVLGARGGSLSGGQQQRLCLARALLRRSLILIVDEPFAHLDTESTARVRRTLRDHSAKGGMVLLISHDPKDMDLADQVWKLEGGSLSVLEAPMKSEAPDFLESLDAEERRLA